MEPLSEGLLRQLITALCEDRQGSLALGQLSVLCECEIELVPSSLTKQVWKVTATLPGPFTALWLILQTLDIVSYVC